MADRWRALSTELALAVFGMFAGIVVLSVLRGIGLWPSSSVQGIGLVSGPAITGIAAATYWFGSRYAVVESRATLPKSPLSRAVMITLAAIALAIGGSIVLGELLELLGVPVAEQGSILEIVRTWHRGEDEGSIVLLGASACVLAPLAEESLFRGLLFARLRVTNGPVLAYGVSALAFALIHANPAGLVIYGWLGLCFAFALERTGRLWPAVAVHMANNMFAFAALLLEEPPV
ncbi:MAG TPA: type II CAAX endopeptidase family protein [Nannocystaceae bacterium]|nr:type II CAAX endopeptidase family protein [Nannocystaceae bacterium]